ncbi:hypothetical protein OPV22_011443 [Ensete ventricosum]|uniref:Ion transport domain-containing protein n=1 Tax=Ensete ventricosum TaxID=4639 RepID=A0AAV8RN11_ENSVE|nr:hypothetical protein OPV22_011443 [Ensete ventricosum]
MFGSRRVDDEMEVKKERAVRFYPNDKQNPAKSTFQGLKPDGYISSRVGNFNTGRSIVFAEDHEPWRKRILDPGSDIALKWNRIFLISCLVALFIDPLYFYLPKVEAETSNKGTCMKMDENLKNLAAALPLPQILIWSAITNSGADHNNNALALIVLVQYIPRLYLIFPLSFQIVKADGVVTKTAWAGAAYNLLLYMIASHVLGASWYLLSVERQTTCWKSECRKENSTDGPSCAPRFLDCSSFNEPARHDWSDLTNVFHNCDPSNDNITFNYGIFESALKNGAFSTAFIKKYFYCLWWGLQNLSSYGQTLTTSTFIGETLFSILIAILGLVLFAHLIGNMQTYLQSITVRLEEWRLKRRDTEEWMRHRQLPHDLRDRVRQFVQYKWLLTRGVDEESILQALPSDLRRDIQRHLCLDLVRRVPFFSQMDDQLLDAIYWRALLLMEAEQVTVNLPSSTRTVRALVEVEAFALRAEDLKSVANQFRRLHSRKLQHTFRLHSHHWRSWAACFIEAAWRRYKRRKMAKDLSTRESFNSQTDEQTAEETVLEEDEVNTYSMSTSQPKQNLGATILASKFAATTRKGAQKIKLQKPEEPDFSADPYD